MSFKVEMIGGDQDGKYWDIGSQLIGRGYVEFSVTPKPMQEPFAYGGDAVPECMGSLQTQRYMIREIRWGRYKYWFVGFLNPDQRLQYIAHINDKVNRYLDLLTFKGK